MPTYDYQCDACDHKFELFQSISEPVKKKCPACGKSKLRRLFGTGAAIVFKGSGFYQTDYRSEAYKKAKKADSGSSDSGSSDSGSSGGGSSDAGKSATKSAEGNSGAKSNESSSSSTKKTPPKSGKD